jgi:hypothetical protein
MRFRETAIEGDARDRLADVARVCGRLPAGDVRELPEDWDAAAALVSQSEHLVGAFNGAWTLLLCGPDLDLCTRPDLGEALSGELGTRVVSGFGNTVINHYGLHVASRSGSISYVIWGSVVLPFRTAPADEPPYTLSDVQDVMWDLGIFTDPGTAHRLAAVPLAPGR